MRLTRVIYDVNMQWGFPGLRKLAKDTGVKNDDDTCIVFINRRQNKFKMLHKNTYLVYYTHPQNKRIPIDAIRFLPLHFKGSNLEMDEAIKQSLANKLGIDVGQLDKRLKVVKSKRNA